MKTIQLEVPEAVLQVFEHFAEQHQRDRAEVMREALEFYRDQRIRPSRQPSPQSILDNKPISLGAIRKPWTSRAEMLKDFFDRT